MNNIFDLDVDILVCPINCDGILGGGLSYKFAQRYPKFDEFIRRSAPTLVPGGLSLYIEDSKGIVGFPTCERVFDGAKIEHIVAGLKKLKDLIEITPNLFPHKPKSIAFPALGCGIGGLDWDDVRPLLEAFEMPGLEVTILGPQ